MAGLFANIDRKSAERAAQREVVRQQALIDAGLGEAFQTREQQQERQAGLLKPALSPFGADTATELGGLLTSGVPALEAQGANTLAGLQQRRAGQAFASQQPLTPVEGANIAASEARVQASQFAGQLSQAQMALLPATQQLAIDAAQRQIVAGEVQNRGGFQTAVQNNKAINAGVNGVKRAQQLTSTLTSPGVSDLDRLNAAVLMTQIIEPGLATRNDDRMAVESGASPGLRNYANMVNQFLGKKISLEEFSKNILNTTSNLMQPIAEGTQQALDFWRAQETNTPGVDAGAVNAMLGLDPEFLLLLDTLTVKEIGT